MKELTKANKVGLMLLAIAVLIIGGMETGSIGFEAGGLVVMICSTLGLLLLK